MGNQYSRPRRTHAQQLDMARLKLETDLWEIKADQKEIKRYFRLLDRRIDIGSTHPDTIGSTLPDPVGCTRPDPICCTRTGPIGCTPPSLVCCTRPDYASSMRPGTISFNCGDCK